MDSGSWEKPVKAAIIQTELHLSDVDGNLRTSLGLMNEALEGSRPDLFVLPEAFTTGFEFNRLQDLAAEAERVNDTLGDFARDNGVNLFFTHIVEDEGGLRNRCHHIGEDGTVRGTYDKTHLFSRIGENEWITPGDGLRTFRMNDISIGPLICYEIRFPELSRRITLEGADMIIYMAQWPRFRIFQWETLLQARAIENQLFVIGVNIWGDHDGMLMGGGSKIIAPYGDIIASMDEGPGWAAAELHPSKIDGIRNKIPVFDDRREKLY